MTSKTDSKGNVFRLSGNMALGAMPLGSYSQEQINQARNSLQLLKSKQSKPSTEESAARVGSYGNAAWQPQAPNKTTLSNNPESMGRGYLLKNPVYQPMEKPNLQNIPNIPRKNKGYQESMAPRQSYEPRQKPISELKREQKLQIRQYSQSELVQCGEGCGRKFNPESLAKHEANCKRVFQEKRKQFNTQAQRIVAKDQVKLMKKGTQANKKVQEMKNAKMPKWKAQSTAFRSIIKQQRNNGKMTVAQQNEYKKAQEALKEASGCIKCPTCGRSFNEKAGQRHIPFCADQAKKNAIKRR